MKSGRSGVLAVVDTNVWISAMLRPGGFASRVVDALADHQFVALTSDALMAELHDVVQRPRLVSRFGLTTHATNLVLDIINERSIRIPDPPTVKVGRDPKDDIFLAVAIAGRANVIVTRDDDLKADPAVLAFAAQTQVRILSVQHFLDAISPG